MPPPASSAARLRAPDDYVARLAALRHLAPATPRRARRTAPARQRDVRIDLLWLIAQFGVVLQSNLGWLIGNFRPEAISRLTAAAAHRNLVEVLLAHPQRTERRAGGGGQAFLVLTPSGREHLEAHVGRELKDALPGFLDAASLLQSPGRAGRTFDHDQRVIAWALAYLWRTGGSVWSLRGPWASDTSLVQPRRPSRGSNETTVLSVDEITRAQFRRDLEWRGLIAPSRRDRLRPDATIHCDPTGCGSITDVHVELQSAAWSELDRKFPKYDRYLAGWCFATARYGETGRRPVVIFACAPGHLEPIMGKAHRLLRSQVTVTGARAGDVYYPARDHVLFCEETALHGGDVRAWRLPAHPRQELSAGVRHTPLLRTVRG
jgi:hypothetical protein